MRPHPTSKVGLGPLSAIQLVREPLPKHAGTLVLHIHNAMMLAQSVQAHYTGAMKHELAGRRYFATDQLKIRIREQGRHNRFVANQIGVSDSHFSRVLTGERWVTEEHARVVADLLQTDFSVLWKVSDRTFRAPRSIAA